MAQHRDNLTEPIEPQIYSLRDFNERLGHVQPYVEDFRPDIELLRLN